MAPASVHAPQPSANNKCQQTESAVQASVCSVQMAVARAEHQVGAFKGPVVVLADMDKAEMDAAVAKGLQGCKMEVQTSLLARSLALSLTHQLAHQPTHPLTHSPTPPNMCPHVWYAKS